MKRLRISASLLAALCLTTVSLTKSRAPAYADDAAKAPPPSAAPSMAGRTAEAHPGWSFKDFGLIPIQGGGRMKPLDSYAREIVLYTTGSHKFQGWEPVDFVLSWLVFPDYWSNQAFIQINRIDVKRELNLDEKRLRFAPSELLNNFALMQYAREMPQATGPETGAVQKKNQRDEEMRRVIDRLGYFRAVVSGESWLVVPRPGDEKWLSLLDKEKDGEEIRARFVDLVKAYQAGDEVRFEATSAAARVAVEKAVPGWNDSMKNSLDIEAFYNRLHPFLWAWVFYLMAALAWMAHYALDPAPAKKVRLTAAVLTSLGLTAHILGMALRCYVAGRPPVTNMYESVIWVSFGIVVFAAIIQWRTKQAMPLTVATVLAMLGLIAGDAAPAILDPGIRPLVPVLRSNYWLTIHVLTITLGYAAFALTLGISNVTLFQYIRKKPGHQAAVTNLNQLTYRAMQFGVVLIAAGTILGGIWADYSWGRFWGWDPKEVWALIVLLSYLAILHGRLTGWIGQFAYAAWSVVGFLSVLMAWYGVNFILGVGLHSYGFSTGGFTAVMTFVAIQGSYVIFAYIEKSRHAKSVAIAPAKA